MKCGEVANNNFPESCDRTDKEEIFNFFCGEPTSTSTGTDTCSLVEGSNISTCYDTGHLYMKHNSDSPTYCSSTKKCPTNKHCLIDKYNCHDDSEWKGKKRYPGIVNTCVDCLNDNHCTGNKSCIGNI